MENDNQQQIPQNADTFSLGSGLSVYSKSDTKNVIKVTNNRAHYFANLAKKFRDEAKIHCENAKRYAEENSNVTYDQLIELRGVLETKINTKQDAGNYALQQDIPVNISELENDSEYITTGEAESLVNTAVPSQSDNSGKFLYTDGNSTSWVNFPSETMFSIKTFDHILDFAESKGYALQGTWVYKSPAPERYGYPDFYEKCIAEKVEVGAGTELTINDLTATIYNHASGHQFYNIEDKAIFDSWSEANTGIWAYGIDEANERILLPHRNIYYTNVEATSNASKIDNNRYQYIVVGNTEDEQTLIDVLPVTTAENDTIPLFTGMYFDFKPNNPSWLKAGEQVNSGGIYISTYNILVNCLNNINPYEINVIDEKDMQDGVDYSGYWKINQNNMSFRTPTTISNKALSGAIRGNDKTIGLTSGSKLAGLSWINTAPEHLDSRTTSYGTAVGTDVTAGTISSTSITLGLTKDSSQSGIIAEEATAQLYFKVANAVQNLEVLNVGQVLENLAGKVDEDSPLISGQWVFDQILITSSTTATQVLDLSDYLPKDNYDYEVMLTVQSYSASDSDKMKWIYTDLLPHNVNWYDTWNNTNTRHTTNSLIYPVGKERLLYVGGTAVTSFYLYAKGYRRLGTNDSRRINQ